MLSRWSAHSDLSLIESEFNTVGSSFTIPAHRTHPVTYDDNGNYKLYLCVLVYANDHMDSSFENKVQ